MKIQNKKESGGQGKGRKKKKERKKERKKQNSSNSIIKPHPPCPVPFCSTLLWCDIYNPYSTYNRACTREEGRKVERKRERERNWQ